MFVLRHGHSCLDSTFRSCGNECTLAPFSSTQSHVRAAIWELVLVSDVLPAIETLACSRNSQPRRHDLELQQRLLCSVLCSRCCEDERNCAASRERVVTLVLRYRRT